MLIENMGVKMFVNEKEKGKKNEERKSHRRKENRQQKRTDE